MAATAVVAVVAGGDPASAELWVVDRMTGKTVVRRVHADPKARRASPRCSRCAPSSCCARASSSWRSRRVPRPTSSRCRCRARRSSRASRPSRSSRRSRTGRGRSRRAAAAWAPIQGASGGTTLLGEFLPVARVAARLQPRACARACRSQGWGRRRTSTCPAATRTSSQTIVLVEGLVRFRRGRRLEPVVSIGAGILYLSARRARDGAVHRRQRLRACRRPADAGVGLRMPLRPRRVELGVEVHALLAEPYPVVRFFQMEVARAGRPSLLASVTLLGGI